jgi:hypothetical protein
MKQPSHVNCEALTPFAPGLSAALTDFLAQHVH